MHVLVRITTRTCRLVFIFFHSPDFPKPFACPGPDHDQDMQISFHIFVTGPIFKNPLHVLVRITTETCRLVFIFFHRPDFQEPIACPGPDHDQDMQNYFHRISLHQPKSRHAKFSWQLNSACPGPNSDQDMQKSNQTLNQQNIQFMTVAGKQLSHGLAACLISACPGLSSDQDMQNSAAN